MTRGRRARGAARARVAVAATLGLGLAAAVAAPAPAHQAGRVELFLTNVEVTEGAGGPVVHADLVDRDSATAARGFSVTVQAVNPEGVTLGPLPVPESGHAGAPPTADRAHHEAALALTTGHWTVTLAAAQGDSAVPAIGTSKAVEVDIEGNDATPPATAPAATGSADRLEMTLEVRRDPPQILPSSLWVPLTATLVHPETRQPLAERYVVRASARSATRPADQQFDFAYPYGDTPGSAPGVYHGVVIVPEGGPWTFVANAYRLSDADTRLPAPVATARLDAEIAGGALESAGAGARRAEPARLWELGLLVVHTLLGGAWFGLAAILAYVGLPARRRQLSSAVNDGFDRHVGRFTSALGWTTALVWATGFLNLKSTVAYAPPLSLDRSRALFELPYAEPYTIALYVKIATYALLTSMTVPLIRHARRQAGEIAEIRVPVPVPVGSADAAMGWRKAVPGPSGGRPGRFSARLAFVALALGGGVIMLCVAVLKYTHILSEELRSGL